MRNTANKPINRTNLQERDVDRLKRRNIERVPFPPEKQSCKEEKKKDEKGRLLELKKQSPWEIWWRKGMLSVLRMYFYFLHGGRRKVGFFQGKVTVSIYICVLGEEEERRVEMGEKEMELFLGKADQGRYELFL